MSSPWLDLGRRMAGRGSSTERAKLGVELQWWMAFCRLDSVGVGHGRVRGGMEELRGEVARLWARWVEAGQREGGEGRPEGERRCSARLGSRELEERDRMDWTKASRASAKEKSGAQTRLPTRGSSPPATVAGMASGRHSDEHSGDTVCSFK